MSDPRFPARIGINAVFLEPSMGGLETYVRELTPWLVRAAPDSHVTVVCNPRGRALLQAEPWASEVTFLTPRVLSLPATKALYETTALGFFASRRFDALLNVALTGPLRTKAANVVLLADVTWLVIDDLGDGDSVTVRLWRSLVPRIARRADRVIALTESGARAIVQELRVSRDRIDVIGLGYAAAGRGTPVPEEELRRRLGIGDGPVVLNVAAKKAHKNLVRLVDAIAIVREELPDVTLVLPGAATPYQDEIVRRAEELGCRSSLVFPGFVSADELEGLYELASCFAFPSLNEGFGLPLLEAMARDVPVVTSAVSAMPEVAGDAALLVDPESPEEIAAAIGQVLRDPAVAERLVAAGRERLQHFTWEHCAEETLVSLVHAASSKVGAA